MRIKYKLKSYWQPGGSINEQLGVIPGDDFIFDSPAELLAWALENPKTNFGVTGLIYTHHYWNGNLHVRHHFHTLAAANRFHKSQIKARVSPLAARPSKPSGEVGSRRSNSKQPA